MRFFLKIIKRALVLFAIMYSANAYSQELEFMGYPIHSSITEYTKVLTTHRFKKSNSAYQYWEGGDFWKQPNCYVYLFAKDDIHVDIIEVRIPYYNFNSPDDYISTVNELLSDLSNKYGQYVYDTLNTEKESDPFFHPSDHKEDLYFLYKWSKPNGELKVLVNADYIYTILIQYKSIEYINRGKVAARFKGNGSSDL